jgi:hypothetical protein
MQIVFKPTVCSKKVKYVTKKSSLIPDTEESNVRIKTGSSALVRVKLHHCGVHVVIHTTLQLFDWPVLAKVM